MLPEEGWDVKEDMSLHSYTFICIKAWMDCTLDMLKLHWKLLHEVMMSYEIKTMLYVFLHCICMHFNCFAEVSSLDCDYDESCMTLVQYLTVLMGLSMLMLYMGCSLLYSSGWSDYYRWRVAFVQVYNVTFLWSDNA